MECEGEAVGEVSVVQRTSGLVDPTKELDLP